MLQMNGDAPPRQLLLASLQMMPAKASWIPAVGTSSPEDVSLPCRMSWRKGKGILEMGTVLVKPEGQEGTWKVEQGIRKGNRWNLVKIPIWLAPIHALR